MAPGTETVEIRGDAAQLARLLLIGVAVTTAFLAIGLGWITPRRMSWVVANIVGWSGTLFFGLCTIIFAWRLLRVRDVRLRISAEGIWEPKYRKEILQWHEVKQIREYVVGNWLRRRKSVLLDVDSATERRLLGSFHSRVGAFFNRNITGTGLFLSAGGLDTTHDDLLWVLRKYWSAAKSTGNYRTPT